MKNDKQLTRQETLDLFGPRCLVFEAGCPVCEAWARYDLRLEYEAGAFDAYDTGKAALLRVLQGFAFEDENLRRELGEVQMLPLKQEQPTKGMEVFAEDPFHLPIIVKKGETQ